MLGLSFSKILLIAFVAVVLWRGLRIYHQVQARLAQQQRSDQAARTAAAGAATSRTTELVECPRCGAFVPNGTVCRSVEECRFGRAT